MDKYSEKDIISLEGEELRRYQQCILEIAKDFVQLCDKFNFDYSLSGGSILGAIRHGGFIPWDDDIDFNITRESYNKLLEIFDEELGDKYYIQTPMNHPELGLMITQIRKKNTIARRKYDWNLQDNECGASIDLYIIENIFDNPVKRYFQILAGTCCAGIISSVRTYKNKNLPPEVVEEEHRKIKFVTIKLFIGRILSVIPLKKWIQFCNYWNSLCKDNDSRLVAIPTGRKHFIKEIYDRSEMCFFKKCRFETEIFNIPVAAEKYLESFYGDYMSVPSEDKREKHLFLEIQF